jgi:hypothetical protein
MQCLARDRRQAPERFLAPISSICTTADAAIAALGLPDGETLARGIAHLFADQPEAEWRAHIEAVAEERS